MALMTNSKTFDSIGKKMLYLIENDMIKKDYLPNHGSTFSGGYEDLYLHKFKKYLGSVSRAIVNRNIAREQDDEN